MRAPDGDIVKPTFVNPARLVSPRGYNHGVLMPIGSGAQLLTVAGQVGWNGDGRLVSSGFTAQFEQALVNVLAVVTEAGGVPCSIVRLTIYVTDKSLYESEIAAVGEAYRRIMGTHFPAIALVEVKGLVAPGAVVEMEAMAVIGGPIGTVPAASPSPWGATDDE
jgi:enamine deaminase RidA (YjgF/YER057c/UK114 family)